MKKKSKSITARHENPHVLPKEVAKMGLFVHNGPDHRLGVTQRFANFHTMRSK